MDADPGPDGVDEAEDAKAKSRRSLDGVRVAALLDMPAVMAADAPAVLAERARVAEEGRAAVMGRGEEPGTCTGIGTGDSLLPPLAMPACTVRDAETEGGRRARGRARCARPAVAPRLLAAMTERGGTAVVVGAGALLRVGAADTAVSPPAAVPVGVGVARRPLRTMTVFLGDKGGGVNGPVPIPTPSPMLLALPTRGRGLGGRPIPSPIVHLATAIGTREGDGDGLPVSSVDGDRPLEEADACGYGLAGRMPRDADACKAALSGVPGWGGDANADADVETGRLGDAGVPVPGVRRNVASPLGVAVPLSEAPVPVPVPSFRAMTICRMFANAAMSLLSLIHI